ncbi:aspartyl protease family protein 2-like [Selaginella moellendorffii]|uniref:aspartyl protease family protein 2-like n=1 Tax=Selaginella moellendorffii TaxID=88036 RepID=UPI000D1C530A|nr:aspartyl protease family protein 2-like [Selaginella moellendorffii]|eukprot:XP_024533162.1 aspartyl protease family protein 2-like [Selaginella moellendorffii]
MPRSREVLSHLRSNSSESYGQRLKSVFSIAVCFFVVRAAGEDRPLSSFWRPVFPTFLQEQVRESLSRIQSQVQDNQNNHLDLRGNRPTSGVRSVVTPLEDYALFSMQLGIGSLQKNLSAIIDTGSEAVLVQCGSRSRPVFDPAASQSYRQVPCISQLCLAVQQQTSNGSSQPCVNSSATCTYSLSYGDSRNSTGDFSQDVIFLNSTNSSGQAVQFRDVAFGCAHSPQGFLVDLGSLGIVGFNRGNLSLPSQLKDRLGGSKFSYCFPSQPWQPRATGVIFLGDSGLSKSKVGYTPLLDNPVTPARSQLYYVGLTSISVDGKTLAIPESAFKLDPSTGDGGTVLDSGTTFTRVVDDAYTAFRNAFAASNRSGLRKKVGAAAGFDDCYNISAGSSLPGVPEVRLSLQNNVRLELRFEHLFVPVSAAGNEVTVCLAILSSQKSGFGKINVLGNYQQSNYLVEYDNERSRVGFERADCSGAAGSFLVHSKLIAAIVLAILLNRQL